MYNKEVVNRRLAKLQPQLSFELRYHSSKEIQQRVSYINNLINLDAYEDGLRTSKTKWEVTFKSQASKKEFESSAIQTFIENESIITKWDCFYWMKGYYWISDIKNQIVLYDPYVPQLLIERIFSKLEKLGRAIRLLSEKARQVGLTTISQGVVEHRIQFFANVRSLVASKDKDSTLKMTDMITLSMDRQPFWLRPKMQSYTTGDRYLYDNNSLLDLGYGTQKTLGKGGTYTVSHLSEIALFQYWDSAIENALIRAMHETKWLLQIFEGTAEARDDDFHKKVKETIKGMEKGTSSLYFSFIPYFVRNDIYPPPAYIAGRSDAYENYRPSMETLIHAKKAERYVLTNQDLREILGSNWIMPRETMFWYETERNAAIAEDRLAVFLSQVPADWEEAFQHAGKTIYPIILITDYADKAQNKNPEVYKIEGDINEISPSFFPSSDELLEGGRTIIVEANWNPSIPKSTYRLVQVKFDGWNGFDPIGKILIWEHPNSKNIYGSGIDTSDGLGVELSDNAILEIIRKGDVHRRDFQVCEFASPDLSMAQMWPFLNCLWTYYSPTRQLLGAIECNKGYELQNAMINRGWWNLYQRIDDSKIGVDLSQNQSFGFLTTQMTRVALIDNFSRFFKGKHIELYSMPLIGEVKDLQKIRRVSAKQQRISNKIEGGLSGDDRFMAISIGMFALHQNEILGFEKAEWEERAKSENSRIVSVQFSGYSFEKSTGVRFDNADVNILPSQIRDEIDNPKLEDFTF